MSEFMLLFRQPSFDISQMSSAEFAAIASRWQAWVGGIEAEGNLVSRGTRLATEGRVVRANGLITDGPFVEIKERLGSFVTVRANSLDEATALAHGCPAIAAGGSVEVRPMLV